MRDIRKITKQVELILTEYPMTRGSDTLLYKKVCEVLNPTACRLSFSTVMDRRAELMLPKWESVSRARRKVQHDRPDLRADIGVTDRRYDNFKIMKEYANE